MPVEDRSLQNDERRFDRAAPGNLPVMAKYASFHGIKRGLRFLTISRDQIECDLSVKYIFRQRLERQEIHGLLVEFVHAALSVLRSRLQNGGDRLLDRTDFFRAQE